MQWQRDILPWQDIAISVNAIYWTITFLYPWPPPLIYNPSGEGGVALGLYLESWGMESFTLHESIFSGITVKNWVHLYWIFKNFVGKHTLDIDMAYFAPLA